MNDPIKVFYCYAREDLLLRNELEKHLSALKRSGQIVTWYDREIAPGADWKDEIHTRLDAAQIILLLVSPDFLNSDYCYGIEMQKAMGRYTRGEAHIVPIILRSVFWKDTPIEQFQLLPTDGKAVTKWGDRDEAYEDIVKGIHSIVTLLQQIEHDRLFKLAEEERERQQQIERDRIQKQEEDVCKCPNCEGFTEKGDFCNNCGAKLDWIKCPNCESLTEKGDFCNECGAPLDWVKWAKCPNCKHFAKKSDFCNNCGYPLNT